MRFKVCRTAEGWIIVNYGPLLFGSKGKWEPLGGCGSGAMGWRRFGEWEVWEDDTKAFGVSLPGASTDWVSRSFYFFR